MPALDRYHYQARRALEKDGWTITNDPLVLRLDDAALVADLGAERIIAAERGTEKIAVEIKSLLGPSPLVDLEKAIGQYSLYEDILSEIDAERRVVLAIPQKAWDTLFSRSVGKLALKRRFHFAFVYEPENEVISRWLP